jgi:hypothetical protein
LYLRHRPLAFGSPPTLPLTGNFEIKSGWATASESHLPFGGNSNLPSDFDYFGDDQGTIDGAPRG